jgi:hypothetical protein
MVARLLNLCGLYLGQEGDLLPPNYANPEGYWENARFVNLNDSILAEYGGGWDRLPTFRRGWYSSTAALPYRAEAAALIKTFRRHRHWGWKDPRNSVTIPFWADLLPDMKVVVCLRSPLEVAQSLAVRGASSQAFSFELWLQYNRRLVGAIPASRRIVTHYASYYREPRRELRRLLEFLGIHPSAKDFDAAILSIKSPRQNQATLLDLLADQPPYEVVKSYQALCAEAGPIYGELATHEPAVPRLSRTKYLAFVKNLQRETDQREASEKARALAAELATRDAQLAALAAQESEREARAASLATQLAEREAQATDLATQLAAREAQATDLATELAALEAQATEMATQVASLRAAAAEREAQTTILANAVGEHARRAAMLGTEVDRLEGQLAIRDARLAQRDAQSARLEAELAAQDRRVTVLSSALSETTMSGSWKLARLLRGIGVRLAPSGGLRARLAHMLSWPFDYAIAVRAKRRSAGQTDLIRRSSLFDAAWYLTRNPDVAADGMDPVRHYLLFGGFEGRDPGPDFSTSWYLEQYPDVKQSGMNPLLHYLRYGKREGRARTPPGQGGEEQAEAVKGADFTATRRGKGRTRQSLALRLEHAFSRLEDTARNGPLRSLGVLVAPPGSRAAEEVARLRRAVHAFLQKRQRAIAQEQLGLEDAWLDDETFRAISAIRDR